MKVYKLYFRLFILSMQPILLKPSTYPLVGDWLNKLGYIERAT